MGTTVAGTALLIFLSYFAIGVVSSAAIKKEARANTTVPVKSSEVTSTTLKNVKTTFQRSKVFEAKENKYSTKSAGKKSAKKGKSGKKKNRGVTPAQVKADVILTGRKDEEKNNKQSHQTGLNNNKPSSTNSSIPKTAVKKKKKSSKKKNKDKVIILVMDTDEQTIDKKLESQPLTKQGSFTASVPKKPAKAPISPVKSVSGKKSGIKKSKSTASSREATGSPTSSSTASSLLSRSGPGMTDSPTASGNTQSLYAQYVDIHSFVSEEEKQRSKEYLAEKETVFGPIMDYAVDRKNAANFLIKYSALQ